MIWRKKTPAINYDIVKAEAARAEYLGENDAPRISFRLVTSDDQRIEFEVPLRVARKMGIEINAAVKASNEMI